MKHQPYIANDSSCEIPIYMQHLRNLREDADYSQEYVAKVLGTSQTMYARYERGANELPIRHALKLCEIYSVSADYLLGREKNKQ